MATALSRLMSLPTSAVVLPPTSIARLERLERMLGSGCPRLFIKRDDLLPFALGGNKVRKLQLLAAEAARQGADALVTCGSVQSNHARVTAAFGATLGWPVTVVLSGQATDPPTGNLRLDRLFGAELRFVTRPEERPEAMAQAATALEARGYRPFVIPLGGSVPLGAMAIARALSEVSAAGLRPDVIVHASSSGGTQAGLIAGCALFGVPAVVQGISADLPAPALSTIVRRLLDGVAAALGAKPESVGADRSIEIDDGQVGPGYALPTDASRAATALVARTEGIVLDSTYTAKAMAGLLDRVARGQDHPERTILFWHTGGLHEY
jgi:D-cysteine desulfhydrase